MTSQAAGKVILAKNHSELAPLNDLITMLPDPTRSFFLLKVARRMHHELCQILAPTAERFSKNHLKLEGQYNESAY